MRIKVRRGRKRWIVYGVPKNYPLDFRAFRIQFFTTWHEAITEALYRSEQIKNQCRQF